MESKKGCYILKGGEYKEDLEKIGTTKEGIMENPYQRKFGKFEIEEIAGAFIQELPLKGKKLKESCSNKRAIVALTKERITEMTSCKLSEVERFLNLMQEDGLVREVSEEEVLEDELEGEVLRPTEKMLKVLKGKEIDHPRIENYLLNKLGFPA